MSEINEGLFTLAASITLIPNPSRELGKTKKSAADKYSFIFF